MSLSDLASIGSFISGMAVLASLVYLSLQIRQNTLAHRATAHMGRYAFAREQMRTMMDPATAALTLRAATEMDRLTEIEAYQVYSHHMAFMLGSEEMFWLHGQGSLDDHAFNTQMTVLLEVLGSRAGRTTWQLGRTFWAPDFLKFVDQKLASQPVSEQMSFLSMWKSAAATTGV